MAITHLLLHGFDQVLFRADPLVTCLAGEVNVVRPIPTGAGPEKQIGVGGRTLGMAVTPEPSIHGAEDFGYCHAGFELAVIPLGSQATLHHRTEAQ